MEVLVKSTDSKTVEVLITEKRYVLPFDAESEGYTKSALKASIYFLNNAKKAGKVLTLYDVLDTLGVDKKQCKMCIFFGWEENEEIEIGYSDNDETLTLYFKCKIL